MKFDLSDLEQLKTLLTAIIKEEIHQPPPVVDAWEYYTLEEAAAKLQVTKQTLLDTRQPYLNEIEYSQAGRLYWFNKASVAEYIKNRTIRRYIK